MHENDINYFDANGFMAPYGENGVLFTTEYIFLRRLAGATTAHLSSVALEAIETTLQPPSDGEPLSHDNMTAIVSISRYFGFSFHKQYFHRDWWWRAHPRDIFFYLYMMGGVARAVSYVGLWFTVLSMVVSCLSRQTVSNGDLDTDSKLLAWLRCEAAGWSRLSRLLEKLNGCTWNKIFNIYFRDENNPIRVYANEIYGGKV